MITGGIGAVTIDAAALARFVAGPGGPVMKDLNRRGTNVQAGARRYVRKRTRTLEKSIIKRSVVDARGPVVVVVAGGRLAPYARLEHDGTRPHAIRARNRKVLRFPARGGVVFAKEVRHPGTTGSRFLLRALPLARA